MTKPEKPALSPVNLHPRPFAAVAFIRAKILCKKAVLKA
ncbi:hypothetical protein EVA_06214 [gut metagenome]|uniref:Uncharacterized protein n=1 Tax=gut metagenome TaxID=749906 RepID=J9GFG7_9ZZZZ